MSNVDRVYEVRNGRNVKSTRKDHCLTCKRHCDNLDKEEKYCCKCNDFPDSLKCLQCD